MINGNSLDRRALLKAALVRACDSETGLKLTINGGEMNARSLAIVALAAAKRELVLAGDNRVLNLVIKPMPFTKNQIVIYKLDDILDEEDEG